MDTETGECGERRLQHPEEAEKFYRDLAAQGIKVRVGMEASGHKYFHLAMRRGRKIAKVAMARKLAVQLFWMMRKEWDYEQVKRFGPHAGQPENRRGVQ